MTTVGPTRSGPGEDRPGAEVGDDDRGTLRAAAAHVFVADLDAPELDDGDRHHLASVLRLRSGEAVTLADGRGSWRLGRWIGSSGGSDPAVVAPDGPVRRWDLPTVAVAVAAVKGDRLDWAVQKATEVGVSELVVFVADRSVVRWEHDRRTKAELRLTRIAREAAMQCRRATLPVVRVVDGLEQVVGRPGAARGGAPGAAAPGPVVVRAEPGGAGAVPAGAIVAIGPEGGWSDAEHALVPATVDLGPTILRTETAVVVAATLARQVPRVG